MIYEVYNWSLKRCFADVVEKHRNILHIQTPLEVRKDEPVVTVSGRGDGRHLRRGWRIILKKMFNCIVQSLIKNK